MTGHTANETISPHPIGHEESDTTLAKSLAVFLLAVALTGCHEWFHSDHDHDGEHQYEAWLEFVQECGLDPMNYSADCKDQAAQLAKNALEDDCPDKQ